MSVHGFKTMQLGGIALIPVGVFWVLFGIPVDLGAPTSIMIWLVTVPYATIGLLTAGTGIGVLIGRVAGNVAGASLGLSSAAWCLTRIILTTQQERTAVAARFADIESTWWLVVVVVCGGLAGFTLLGAPDLREDSAPTGGPIARDSWQWAALAVACIQLVYVAALFALDASMHSDQVVLPSTMQSVTVAVLWLGCAVVAAAARGLWAVITSAGLALAAVVVQIIFDAQVVTLGFPGVSDLRVWLAAWLVVTAFVCLWALPLLRGWTPATRRQLAERPKGFLD